MSKSTRDYIWVGLCLLLSASWPHLIFNDLSWKYSALWTCGGWFALLVHAFRPQPEARKEGASE